MLYNNIRTYCLCFAILAYTSFQAFPQKADDTDSWTAPEGLVDTLNKKHSGFIYDEKDVPEYSLPELLVMENGKTVKNARKWKKRRRKEILDQFGESVYGFVPLGKTGDIQFNVYDNTKNALNGKAVRKQIRVYFTGERDGPFMDILIYLPYNSDHPVPLFLGLNFQGNHTIHNDPDITLTKSWIRNGYKGVVDNRATEVSRGVAASRWPVEEILKRGYGLATIYYGDIDPDFDDGFQNGVHPLLDKGKSRQADSWGAIAAWAWGLSRAMDYLEKDGDIDAKRVAVIGHSRLGKTSLWAGAQDERFSLVISNCSGCGGAALSRRKYGETVERINTSFPHWFCENFKKYNNKENDLPVDQHMLIALIAPRPVYIVSADRDLWADPRGEFLSGYFASPVYRLFGEKGLAVDKMPPLNTPVQNGFIAYHIRSGKHDLTLYDWKNYLNFADKHLK